MAGKQKRVKPSKALTNVKAYRTARGMNQQRFWAALGTTQSGGSRYENARDMPVPVRLLIVLEEQGKITRDDLALARAIADATGPGGQR
jgi:hypothetical protein